MKSTMKTTTPSQPMTAATTGRRAQPIRQTRTNPARNLVKAGGSSSLARSSGVGHHDGQKANKPPGFCPAIMHFTDSITALPKEVVRHFGLLNEVDAKLYGPEHSLRELTEIALDTPAPAPPASRRLMMGNAPVAPQASTDLPVDANAGPIATGDASATSVSNRVVGEQSDWARRQLFFNLRVTLSEILGSLDEKNHVIQTATQALSRQIARCESSYLYLDNEISEEAHYGSLTHWAYAEKAGGKTNGTSNERPRRDAANAGNLAGVGVPISEEAAASRSESRREAMLAKKNRLQPSDALAAEGGLGRQRGAASTPAAAVAAPSKKGNGTSKSKKPAESVPVTAAATTHPASSGPDPPPSKRRRTEKLGASRTAPMAPPVESPVLEQSELARSVGKIDARSPRSTPATEAPKKRVRGGATTTTGNPRRRNMTSTSHHVDNVAPTAASPSLASSPVQPPSAVASKDPPGGSPVLQPTQPRPATSRGRQESGQSVVPDVAPNGRRRPSTSSASNKLHNANGVPASAADSDQGPPSAKPSLPELKVIRKGTPKPPKESSVDNRNGRGLGDASKGGGGSAGAGTSKVKENTDRAGPKEDAEGGPLLQGALVGGNNPSVTSVPTLASAPRAGSKSSKTSTPVTANFPEMHRSRSSRGVDGTGAPKRSHKKGAGAAGAGAGAGAAGGGGVGGSGAGLPPQHGQPSPRRSSPEVGGLGSTTIKDEHNDTAGLGPDPGRVLDGNRDGDADEAPPADEEEEEEEGDNAPEPRYCYCNQVSYGSMVACDAQDCPREWFHLNCVGLTRAPGKNELWFCDECKEHSPDENRQHPLKNESSNGNGSHGDSTR